MPRVSRCFENFALAILCLAGFNAIANLAHAEPAEPGQIIGYANADRSGPSQVWDLPPDKPYLYVPAIPASLDGRIMAVETGPEVGVALFKGPYFTSRDQGCQPTLGTAQAPRKSWLGATARFAPAPAGQAGASELGYGSLIVYRADLGPPPGALFLNRRVTLGRRCANPAHKTVYNRIFVPVAEAPNAARCFDLVGNYPGSNKPFQLDFVKSDRVVLMMPGDMSERYATIRHDYTVTLYDGLSCTGVSTTLDSRARANRDVRLTQMDFRDRARSLRLNYDYGNADAFLVRQETPPATPQPATTAQKPEPTVNQDEQTLTAQPIEDPAVGQSPLASTPVPIPEPELPSSAPPAEAPATKVQEAELAAQPVPETPSLAQVEPPAELPARADPPPPPSPAPAKVAAAPPAQSMEAPAILPKPDTTASASSEQAPIQPAVPTPAPVQPPVETPVESASSAPQPAQQSQAAPPTAGTIPKLSPRLAAPSTQTAAVPSLPKTFSFPVQDIYRLNHCLYWQRDCGEPAATAWCRANGFSKALAWTVDENIGTIFPTVIFGNQEVCAKAECDGFKKITCTP